MKNLLLVLTLFVIVFACKKDEVEPPVVVIANDHADSLVGTYIGQEIRYDSDNYTQKYNNSTKTMTVVKLSKNKIQVSSFHQGPEPIFTLSDRGDGNILLTPEGMTAYSTGWNVYFLSVKQLNIYVKDGIPLYYYFQGTKQ